MKPHRLKKEPHFAIGTFLVCEDQETYLLNALTKESEIKNINPSKMDVEQLQVLTKAFSFTIKRKLLHELFLFATHSKDGVPNENKRMIALVNKTKISIDLLSVSKWLIHKLQQKKIILGEVKTTRSYSQQIKIGSTKKEGLLPTIIGKSPTDRFETQVSKVIEIFQKMEKQRQNIGLIPIPIDSEDEVDPEAQPISNIPYDADFHDVNQNLFKLKKEAEQRINNIIETAKQDKKLKWRLERSMHKYQRVRTEANEKIGRGGAMKAHKRMIDRSKNSVQAIDNWRKKQNFSLFV